MITGLIGRKIGMTQIFDKEGNVIPVTVVEAGPCPILGFISTPSKKIKIGFEAVKESRINKPDLGFFKKIGVSPLRYIREIEATALPDAQGAAGEAKDSAGGDKKEEKKEAKADEQKADARKVEPKAEAKKDAAADEGGDAAKSNEPATFELKIGTEIKANMFRPGDYVDVRGESIGKGFQGGMKRWNWSGGPGGHGSMHHRRVGSIGASAYPSRTFKGRHMPGQMGNCNVTVQGLRVMHVDAEQNILLVEGSVPGSKGTVITVTLSKKKKYQSLDEKKAVHAVKRNPMKQSKAKAAGKK